MNELKEFFENARKDNLAVGYSIDYRGYNLIYDKKRNHNIVEIWNNNYINDSAVDKLRKDDFEKWEREIDSMIEYGCENIQDWREWAKEHGETLQ